MGELKPGDTAYVIATCADTWKRGSGVCWFYENSGCPFQASGRLEYCGEREDVLDVFTAKVELVEHDAILLQGMTFGFSILCESVSKRYIGKRVFTDRADAVAALEVIKRERERKRQERKQAALIVPGQCGMFAEV